MLRRARSSRDERGFTLVELLVALTAGLVVIFGASAVMLGALRSTSQVQARVLSTQQGRVGLEQLVQQLNSGCLVSGVSPVQSGTASGISPAVTTDGNDLVFVSGLGDSTTGTPTEHVVSISGGALVDAAYANTGGSSPADWTFSSTPQEKATLIEHASNDAGAPLFQYYSYGNPSNLTPDSLVGAAPLDPTAPTFDASSVAEVGIDLVATPSSSGNAQSSSVTLQDAVTFRLTPADPLNASDPGAVNQPCE